MFTGSLRRHLPRLVCGLSSGLLCAAVACACHGPARPDQTTRSVTFTSADGVELHGTLYPVAQTASPGLVLVHREGADRREWEPFAIRARQAGFLCLAFDLRGHGESTTQHGRTISYRDFDTAAWGAAIYDMDAALHELIRQGTSEKNIALVGADLGANLALRYARAVENVAALVLVSPGLDYKGIRTESEIAAYGQRPVLLVTSEGDSYSASSCSTLRKAASGLCELREYPGSAHGTSIFDASETAREDVLLWLESILKS